jgi:leucyl aminopeptidase
MLKLRIGASAPRAAVTILPLAEGQSPPEAARPAAKAADFTGKGGEICDVTTLPDRLVLVGLGADPDLAAYRAAGALAVARLPLVARLALDARALLPDMAAAFAAGAVLRAWRAPTLQTRPDPDASRLSALHLLSTAPGIEAAWHIASAALRGNAFARDLVTEPSNILTPDGFIERLAPLRQAGVQISVMKRRDLEKAGLGCLLAVGRGSEHPPRLVTLRWPGAIEAPPVAFIGKGITFDTGGICIKPANGMWEMRADMAGAAACAGAMLSLALRASPAPAIAVLALAENAIGADSYRPGDVLHSFSGRSVEVVDTDAEGRLVLADALAWAVRRHHPSALIDLATLTGSIVTALGHHMAGLFSNDAPLADAIIQAGAAVGERVWAMPISDRHRRDLDSDIADLRHCVPGRGQPDACQAAAFLREFAEGTPWAHLDIAGVDSHEADDDHAAGATGFGVRLLDRLVARHFEDPHRA